MKPEARSKNHTVETQMKQKRCCCCTLCGVAVVRGKIAGAPGHAFQRQHEHGQDHSLKRILKDNFHGEARAHGQNAEAEPCQFFENEISCDINIAAEKLVSPIRLEWGI